MSDLRVVTDHVEHNCGSMGDFFKKYETNEKMHPVLANLIEQLMVVVFVLNYDWGIFHNDLHWGNVLVQEVGGSGGRLTYRLADGKSYTVQPVAVEDKSYRVVIIDYGRMFQVSVRDQLRPLSQQMNNIGKVAAFRHENLYLKNSEIMNKDAEPDLIRTISTCFQKQNKRVFPEPFLEKLALMKRPEVKTQDSYLEFSQAVVERYAHEFFLPLFGRTSSHSDYPKAFDKIQKQLAQAMLENNVPPYNILVDTSGRLTDLRRMEPCPTVFPDLSLFREAAADPLTHSDRAALASDRAKNMFILLARFMKRDAAGEFCPRAGSDDTERQGLAERVLNFYVQHLPRIAAWYSRVVSHPLVFQSDSEIATLDEALEFAWLGLRCALEAVHTGCYSEVDLRLHYRWLSAAAERQSKEVVGKRVNRKIEAAVAAETEGYKTRDRDGDWDQDRYRLRRLKKSERYWGL
jgi:hypothetical protein